MQTTSTINEVVFNVEFSTDPLTLEGVYLEGHDVTEMLASWVIDRIIIDLCQHDFIEEMEVDRQIKKRKEFSLFKD